MERCSCRSKLRNAFPDQGDKPGAVFGHLKDWKRIINENKIPGWNFPDSATQGGITMIYLIALADLATADLLQAGAVETVAETQMNEIVSTVSGISDPIATGFMTIAVLAFACIWFLMTRKAYPTRRYRRTLGKGPFSRMRDAFVGKASPFAP